jgi:hypothetical protein
VTGKFPEKWRQRRQGKTVEEELLVLSHGNVPLSLAWHVDIMFLKSPHPALYAILPDAFYLLI